MTTIYKIGFGRCQPAGYSRSVLGGDTTQFKGWLNVFFVVVGNFYCVGVRCPETDRQPI